MRATLASCASLTRPRSAQPPPARGGEEARAAGRTDAWRERGFTSLEEWRAHTCSDLYRLNARRKSSGRAALTESEFSALVEAGDVSSISGGSSSSSSEGEGESEHGRRARGRSALDAKVVFSDARGGLFAVWRAALCSAREEKEESAWGRGTCAPARLRALRASTGLWLLVLARGGHFAAAVVRCSGPGGCSAPLLSRTFHRYVVRAKQGGRQGSKDATGKSIKSAGSALRRANEQALEREVRQLLGGEWRQQLTACELVWLAVSETDRRILLTGPEAPLQKEDERLRRVPFATRRPTLSEAKRVATQLAQVQLGVAPGSESEGDSEGEGEGGELSRPDPEPAAQEGPLHAAARSGDAVRVLQLLREGADPGARSARGCTPAALARDRPTRDAFRRARAEEGAEGRWDWDAAGVGAALSEEAVAAHAERRACAEQRRLAQQDQRRRQRAAEQEQQARAQAEREERDATALEQALSGAPPPPSFSARGPFPSPPPSLSLTRGARTRQGRAARPAPCSRARGRRSEVRGRRAQTQPSGAWPSWAASAAALAASLAALALLQRLGPRPLRPRPCPGALAASRAGAGPGRRSS